MSPLKQALSRWSAVSSTESHATKAMENSKKHATLGNKTFKFTWRCLCQLKLKPIFIDFLPNWGEYLIPLLAHVLEAVSVTKLGVAKKSNAGWQWHQISTCGSTKNIETKRIQNLLFLFITRACPAFSYKMFSQFTNVEYSLIWSGQSVRNQPRLSTTSTKNWASERRA